mmetsp:Transcript_31287/g.52175  ORF Transcript_31287/g.52175 Transcript_31287/m.52175 type:complete len:132 (+) Transcript_31287:329-724(+)|eukprot:CAMPEP_0178756196 /NCGR_PEP_ID=MMETSP0744-20121128/13144_1 /TAXON_ID=913974 /ORGANISM="Nitzschia punctata, Strain CCMP561" /LENGTH=131 /DNA_ID=CAMNT_0020410319 /DNA_START=353 /DNA_END=748 /DNA_ORIENTATION=+
MPVDTSYAYFSAPDEQVLPTVHSIKTIEKEQRTPRPSYADIISYTPSSRESRLSHTYSSGSTLLEEGLFREEWVTDYSYGYFDCPSVHPEPSIHKAAEVEVDQTQKPMSKTPANSRRSSLDSLEGYSFFGI